MRALDCSVDDDGAHAAAGRPVSEVGPNVVWMAGALVLSPSAGGVDAAGDGTQVFGGVCATSEASALGPSLYCGRGVADEDATGSSDTAELVRVFLPLWAEVKEDGHSAGKHTCSGAHRREMPVSCPTQRKSKGTREVMARERGETTRETVTLSSSRSVYV